MASELQVKEVNFNGDQIIAIQEIDGSVYVGVTFICIGIGLNEKQKDRQVANIQSDIVLKRGAKKLPLKFEGQHREILCIMIDYLPLWLAKITITPAIKKNNPALVEKLIEYQLKAKDVLAAAFVPEQMQITNPYELLLKNINDNQRLLVVEQSKLSDKLSQHLETYAEDKEAFNQTSLSIGYEIEDLKQQVNKEVIERTSYIPMKPLISKMTNCIERARIKVIERYVTGTKNPDLAENFKNRINDAADTIQSENWKISDISGRALEKKSGYSGDAAFCHDICLYAYQYYKGEKIVG